MLRAVPGVTSVETWAQDEARLGLQPVLRRVWSPRGERPIAWSQPALPVAVGLRLRPSADGRDALAHHAGGERCGDGGGTRGVRP